VQDGYKSFFLKDLTWLSSLAPVVYSFQNTADGFKLLYADGVFCEFAVFEERELHNIPFATGRIVWKAATVPDSIAQPTRVSTLITNSLEYNLGEVLTNLYIGMKRFARGEKLSAARFVQHFALDRVLELAESLESVQNALADPFNRERRIEQRYPDLAGQLGEFVQGYERTPESALAILDWLERHFEVNAGIARAIRDVIEMVYSNRVHP
jgi:hypothetical protein